MTMDGVIARGRGYAIVPRWRIFGGGYDIIEGNTGARSLLQCAPVKIAWFRDREQAIRFVKSLA